MSEREEYLTRVRNRMDRVDALPPAVRELVHEWGLSVIMALWDVGVRKPNQMKHVIDVILCETRGPDMSPYTRRGSSQLGHHKRQP